MLSSCQVVMFRTTRQLDNPTTVYNFCRVSFTQRYLLWLTAPPAAVTIPLAFLFVAQVITLSAGTAVDVLLLLLWMYVVAALAYGYFLTPHTRRVEEAIAAEPDASKEMSDCF